MPDPIGGGGSPNPGFRIDYDPETKRLTITWNDKVTRTFDYQGNEIPPKK